MKAMNNKWNWWKIIAHFGSKIPFILLCAILTVCKVFAEPVALKVGDRLPLTYLEQVKQISAVDFPQAADQSKLYILDFWSTGCSSCMESFAQMEALQFIFRKDIKIIAINPWQNDEKVAAYMASSRHYRMTTLPAFNGDSSWRVLFPTRSVPHHVWLDSTGKVLAITGGYNTTQQAIHAYLNGQLPKMLLKPSIGKYDLQHNSLERLLGAEALPYKDGFLRVGPFHEGEGGDVYGYQHYDEIDTVRQTIRYSFVNTSFYDLYRCAWIMRSDAPLLRSRSWTWPMDIPDDRIQFNLSVPEYYLEPNKKEQYDQWCLRTKFCVEFILPLAKANEVSELFFAALNKYFSTTLCITGKLVVLDRMCLVVKKLPSSDLSTKHPNLEERQDNDENTQIRTYINTPFKNVIWQEIQSVISPGNSSNGYMFKPALLLNETGIKGNVDIQFNLQTLKSRDPLERLTERLKGTGLTAEWAVRKVKMLVISDDLLDDDMVGE